MAVGLYITERCLQNCRFCFNWKVEGKQDAIDMAYADIRYILDEAKLKGHRYLTITGGEPFLHPNIIDVIGYAHDLGFMINEKGARQKSLPLSCLAPKTPDGISFAGGLKCQGF